MRDFIIGVFTFTMITYGLFLVNSMVSPYNHFSLLEWVGLMGIGIIFKAGIDTYNQEVTE